jgi:hypothetical protein
MDEAAVFRVRAVPRFALCVGKFFSRISVRLGKAKKKEALFRSFGVILWGKRGCPFIEALTKKKVKAAAPFHPYFFL